MGYWVTAELIRAGRRYAAFLQVGLGYFEMLFILVHGWDGRGYQRFFSKDQAVFGSPGAASGVHFAGMELGRLAKGLEDWRPRPAVRELYDALGA